MAVALRHAARPGAAFARARHHSRAADGGSALRIEPLPRAGEDERTTRARLLYQSRKRGIFEADLLLSTFAAARLAALPPALLAEYDRLLDENDWDIYYWATQRAPAADAPPPADLSSAAAAPPPPASPSPAAGSGPPVGEWAHSVGSARPAYRPVPRRWQNSEILALLREHVRARSATGGDGSGMAFMPPLDAKQAARATADDAVQTATFF